MSEKKGFLSGLFGRKKSGGCCSMEIIEENDAKAKEEQSFDCGCSCGCTSETSGETQKE